MNNEPDWDKAPEGATHVLASISGYSWYKLEGGVAYLFDKVWMTLLYSEEELLRKPRFVQIPTVNQKLTVPVVKEKFTTEEVVCSKMETTTWDGQGFPPVGTVCEVAYGGGIWVVAKILYYKHNGVRKLAAVVDLSDDEKGGELFWTDQFRPIKSDRDKWIESIIGNKEELYKQLGHLYDIMTVKE